MAELLIAKGYGPPDPLAAQLREELPEPFFVVVGAVIRRRVFDAVVVTEQGLLVLHLRDWSGEISLAANGAWAILSRTGSTVSVPNPTQEVGAHNRALREFFSDEFQTLRPEVQHLVILTNPGARLSAAQPVSPSVVEEREASAAILRKDWTGTGPRLSQALRSELALALKERRLTRSQRAGAPFTFRSGSTFGTGRQVWTIRDAIRHMDRHPDDGIFHLRNGTLVNWFEEQGAEHMVRIARVCLRVATGDDRETLEMFLVSTGIVPRPAVSILPKTIDMGALVSGDSASARIRIERGPGRGYLYGTVDSDQPWLRIEPHRLVNGKLDAVATVDTRLLAIRRQPYLAHIELRSNADSKPHRMPVRFQVTGLPAAWQTWLLRPILHGAVAGALGFLLGWLLEGAGMVAIEDTLSPEVLSVASVLDTPNLWASSTAALWAAFGFVRGLRSRRTHGVAVLLGRWTLSLLFWAVLLLLVGRIALAAWGTLASSAAAPVANGTVRLVLGAASLAAVIPATWSEFPLVSLARHEARLGERANAPVVQPPLWRGRRLLFLATGLLLLAVVWIGPGSDRISSATAAIGQWATATLAQLEKRVNSAVDDLLLRYYDRRAPEQPTPQPVLSPLPAPDEPVLPVEERPASP